MNPSLVNVETEDKIVLHGAFYEGDYQKPAVIIMHGAAMNFYTGVGRFLPNIINAQGYACLSANNRGHDFGTAPDGDRKPVLGLMRERFQDCIYDVRAWIDSLVQHGYQQIVLLGHSQAIPKILYSQNTGEFPMVIGLALLGPPPSVSEMLRFLVSDNYYERGLFKARELTELGITDQLIVLRGRGTMPWIFTPDTFLNFYGPGTPADTEELIKNVDCPVLLVRGSNDFEPVSRDLLDRIKHNAAHSETCDIVEIEGADHFYTQHEEVLGDTVLRWLDKINIQSLKGKG